MEYLTTEEVGKLWGISDRRVRILCDEGRIEGAFKQKGQWLIPNNAKRLDQVSQKDMNISIVTTGPMGPGIEIAKYLLELGNTVCIITKNSKNEELIRSVIDSKLLERAIIFSGCLYDEEFLNDIFENIKQYTIKQIYFTEILANFNSAEENTSTIINNGLNYHTKGIILACAKFYPCMKKTKLIFMIPKRAALKGIANQTLWSCIWSGVVGFTESLRAACAVGETFEIVNVYHGAILSEFWKMDAMGMPVEIPVNFIDAKDLSRLVVDTISRESSVRVSELHFERLGIWKR